jgi:hypothetical protein
MSTGNPRRGELWVVLEARRLGFGPNPMRRPSDRLEAGFTLLALLTALLMVPAGAAVGTSVRHASESGAAAQRVLLRQVQARTAEDAPALTGQEIGRITWPVLVVWQDENGFDHQGTTDSMLGTKAGTELPVWLDRNGALAEPPRPSGDSQAMGFVAGMGSITGGWLVLWMLFLAARCRLNQRRAAAWAAEWRRVAPRWTRHDT